MKPENLIRQLKTKTPPLVIDVRSGFEYASGHIPKSINLPVSSLPFKRASLPKDLQTLLVITCEHGPRAVLAKGILGLLGFKNCELLDGHMLAYRQKEFPLEK
jgi:hydroxyacylglutathione hydrolase